MKATSYKNYTLFVSLYQTWLYLLVEKGVWFYTVISGIIIRIRRLQKSSHLMPTKANKETTMDDYTPTKRHDKNGKYIKKCAICGSTFNTIYKSKEMCSYECKLERARENSRIQSREKLMGLKRITPRCQSCNYWLSEVHHEGTKKIYRLCPNCHSSITRGFFTLEQVLAKQNTYNPYK